MNALGYFALLLSVMYMLACQGSGGGSSAPADNSVNLKDKDGNPYFTKPLSFGGLSTDIVKGRVVYKQFTAAYGHGVDKITADSCASRNDEIDEIKFEISGRMNINNVVGQQPQQPQQMGQQNYQQQYNPQMGQMGQQYPYNNQMGQQYNPQMQQQNYQQQQTQQQNYYFQQQQTQMQQQQEQYQRTLTVRNSNNRNFKPSNIEMNFDGNGVLLVRITDRAGMRTSQPILPVISGTNGGFPPPQSYVLVAPSTLIIGSFSVSGAPEASYVREILNSRGLVRAYDEFNSSNYSQYAQSSYMQNNLTQQKGFRTDYEPGQNPNMPAPQPQASSTQLGSNAAPVSAATATFDPMVFIVRTADGINNNHIYQLDVPRETPVVQRSSTLVVDSSLNQKSCHINSTATIKKLTLVKSN